MDWDSISESSGRSPSLRVVLRTWRRVLSDRARTAATGCTIRWERQRHSGRPADRRDGPRLMRALTLSIVSGCLASCAAQLAASVANEPEQTPPWYRALRQAEIERPLTFEEWSKDFQPRPHDPFLARYLGEWQDFSLDLDEDELKRDGFDEEKKQGKTVCRWIQEGRYLHCRSSLGRIVREAYACFDSRRGRYQHFSWMGTEDRTVGTISWGEGAVEDREEHVEIHTVLWYDDHISQSPARSVTRFASVHGRDDQLLREYFGHPGDVDRKTWATLSRRLSHAGDATSVDPESPPRIVGRGKLPPRGAAEGDELALGRQGSAAFVDAARAGDLQRVQNFVTNGVEVDGLLGAQALGAALQGAADQHSFQIENFRVVGIKKRPSANRKGCLRVAQRLLELGVSPDAVRIQGYSPAGATDTEGRATEALAKIDGSRMTGEVVDLDPTTGRTIKYTTGKPGKVVPASEDGISLFEYALREELSEFLDLLRKQVDATGLWHASELGLAEVVKELLAANADVNATRLGGATPLWIASENGHADVVQLLLAAKADVDAARTNGVTPLWQASSQGHAEVVQLLLAANADIDAARSDGTTPLWIASHEDHLRVVSLLLAAKADVNAAHKNGITPLYIASQNGFGGVVEVLVTANTIDVNAAHTDGRTPLWMASLDGNVDIVQLLVDAKADVNAAHTDGRTPLRNASANGHTEVVRLLLAANADVDARRPNGATALIVASWNGHADIVELLLAANADVNAAASAGGETHTSLSVARMQGHERIIELLLDHGARE